MKAGPLQPGRQMARRTLLVLLSHLCFLPAMVRAEPSRLGEVLKIPRGLIAGARNKRR